MTVDYLSRHLKRDVGVNSPDPQVTGEIEAVRPLTPTSRTYGRVGRMRMRSLWLEAGYIRPAFKAGKHRRGRL
jgi:hypothetical protein